VIQLNKKLYALYLQLDKLYKTTTFVVTNECMLYIDVNKIFNIMVKFMTYRRRWVLARALHVLVLWLLARQGCEGGLIFYLFSYLFIYFMNDFCQLSQHLPD